MKHGRRHKTLKEQVYTQRFHQDAPGYARPVAPIDVAEPTGAYAPEPLPEGAPLGLALPRKAQRQLRRAGIDPLE